MRPTSYILAVLVRLLIILTDILLSGYLRG